MDFELTAIAIVPYELIGCVAFGPIGLLFIPAALLVSASGERIANAKEKKFIEKNKSYLGSLDNFYLAVVKAQEKIIGGDLKEVAQSVALGDILKASPALKERFVAAIIQGVQAEETATIEPPSKNSRREEKLKF